MSKKLLTQVVTKLVNEYATAKDIIAINNPHILVG